MTINFMHGDAIELFGHIDSESVDMIFADPPFNVGKSYDGSSGGDRRIDYYAWCNQWIGECFRVLRSSGTLYLMTIPRHLGAIYPMMHSRGVFISHINWKNVSSGNNKRSYWSACQPILAYGKTDQYTFNTYAQVRDQSQVFQSWSASRRARSRGQLLDYWDDIPRVYAGSIRHREAIIRPGTRQKIHPCQMPVGLSSRCIMFSTNTGDTVLDPFSGSGTVAESCALLDRNFIGFEKSDEYMSVQISRLQRVGHEVEP